MTPSANAAASDGELSRMSWPITTWRAPSPRISRANARADVGDERLVDLLADQPAHVIRLDDAVDSRGGPGHTELLTTGTVGASLAVGCGRADYVPVARSRSGRASRWGRATPAGGRAGGRSTRAVRAGGRHQRAAVRTGDAGSEKPLARASRRSTAHRRGPRAPRRPARPDRPRRGASAAARRGEPAPSRAAR